MFGRIANFFAKRRARKAEKHSAGVIEPVFVGSRLGHETVIFVHGLAGHFRDTWKQFPELVKLDPDLPQLDILLAGYDASPFPWAHSVELEGKRFVSTLRALFTRGEKLFLVGHSMGGLLILQGLVEELTNNRATKAPASGVRHVTLYASPTMGTEFASMIKLTLGKIPAIKRIVSKQIEDLSAGEFCNILIREVVDRIYHPKIQAGEASSKRTIAITACVALRDQVVAASSAESIFKRPPAHYLDYDHFSIKEPVSRNDLRYLPLKNMLEAHFVDWLDHCRTDISDQQFGSVAKAALLRRLRHALEARLAVHPDLNWAAMSKAECEQWVLEYLSLVVDPASSKPGMRLADVLNVALQGL